MVYIVVGLVVLLMVGASLCPLLKVGEKEGICKYDNSEE